MTERAATWCSECMSDSHNYPHCPKDDGAPLPDLSAQIRATLDAWAQPSGIIEFPEPLTEAQYADLAARFKAAQLRPNEVKVIELPPSPFDRMRAALLAVLDEHPPFVDGTEAFDDGSTRAPFCRTCVEPAWRAPRPSLPWPCPTVLAIAGKLGIETHDD